MAIPNFLHNKTAFNKQGLSLSEMSLVIKRQLMQMAKDGMLTSNDVDRILPEIEKLTEELEAKPATIGWDLICFRTRQLMKNLHLGGSVINRWNQFWANTSRQHRYSLNLNYKCPKVYQSLDYCDYAFEILKDIYISLKSVSDEELVQTYLDAFFKLRTRCLPSLTPSEREVFLAIIKEQSLSPSLLAERLGRTQGHMAQIAKTLLSKQILVHSIHLDLTALNLKVMFGLVELDNANVTLPACFSTENPWIYSLYDSNLGNRFILASFIVPDIERTDGIIDKWVSKLREYRGVSDVHVFTRDERFNWRHLNYDLYDGKRWNIPNMFYGPSVKSKFKSDEIEPIKHDPPSRTKGYSLSLDDLKIINEFWMNGPLPVRTVRKQLKKDYNYVRMRLNDLYSRGIIRERIWPSPIFASEALSLVAEISLEEHTRLSRALEVIPEVYSMRSYTDQSIFFLRLPEGQSPFLASDIRSLLQASKLWLNQYFDELFVDWAFPISRFQESDKTWIIKESDFKV